MPSLFAALVAGVLVSAPRAKAAVRKSTAPSPALLLLLLVASFASTVSACSNTTSACGPHACCTTSEVCVNQRGNMVCASKQQQKISIVVLVVFLIFFLDLNRRRWMQMRQQQECEQRFEKPGQELSEQALPGDLFAPRADEMLLKLDSIGYVPSTAAAAAQEGTWLSRMCIAHEGILPQRPAGWTDADGAKLWEANAQLPFNAGFSSNSAPQLASVRARARGAARRVCTTSAPRLTPLRPLAQVDAAAWQALFVALRSGCDTRSDPYFLGSLGVRIFDVRCAVTEAVMRNFAKLQFIDPKNRFGPGMSYLVFTCCSLLSCSPSSPSPPSRWRRFCSS